MPMPFLSPKARQLKRQKIIKANQDLYSTPPPPVIYHSNNSLIDFSFNQLARLIILTLVFLLLPTGAPASAQGCGLPASGSITASATYTLTADCTQTGTLGFGESDDPNPADEITITINGGGHTITGATSRCSSDGLSIFDVQHNVSFNLNNVTIKNGGRIGGAAVELHRSRHSATISNVTFANSGCKALQFDNQTASAITHSLSNLLFEGGRGAYYATAHGMPAAIHTIGPVDLNINNIVLRFELNGNAAIGANDTYIGGNTATIGTITFSGCFTADGVFPRIRYGGIVDNSEGPCSGTIGNGGSSAMQHAQRAPMPCGLPNGGFVYGRNVFNLKSDCAQSGFLLFPYESDVVINGNGHTIDLSAVTGSPMLVAGKFSLRNVVLTGSNRFPIVTYLDKHTVISNSIFRDNAGPLVLQDNFVTLEKVLIENHQQSANNLPNSIFVIASAQVTIRDSVIRGNSGGVGALYAGAPFQYGVDPGTTLEGCITFEGNSPRDILDPNSLLTDNRSEPCPPDMVFLVKPSPAAPAVESSSTYTPPAGVCDGIPDALPVGAIACVFREVGRLMVYRVDEESRGHFRLGATQAQVDANGTGMVAASPDGFAAVYKLEDGNVMVSVGPNKQGMTLNVTLDGGVNGRALGMTASNGPPAASPPKTQAGSSALQSCMVTTLNILNFRDAPAGNVKRILPYNVTLTAFERAPDWFYVDYHGDRGWIHADYVRTHGHCG